MCTLPANRTEAERIHEFQINGRNIRRKHAESTLYKPSKKSVTRFVGVEKRQKRSDEKYYLFQDFRSRGKEDMKTELYSLV